MHKEFSNLSGKYNSNYISNCCAFMTKTTDNLHEEKCLSVAWVFRKFGFWLDPMCEAERASY